MSPLRIQGTNGQYSEIAAPAVAGDQTFTLPGTGGTLDRLNRAGNILQVVSATLSTQASNSLSTYADTGLTATITPTSASSKILVIPQMAGCGKDTGNTRMQVRLLRNATEIAYMEDYAGFTSSTASSWVGSISTAYLDSPATTSAVTYKTQFKSQANVAVVYVCVNSSLSTITLLEVAA